MVPTRDGAHAYEVVRGIPVYVVPAFGQFRVRSGLSLPPDELHIYTVYGKAEGKEKRTKTARPSLSCVGCKVCVCVCVLAPFHGLKGG